MLFLTWFHSMFSSQTSPFLLVCSYFSGFFSFSEICSLFTCWPYGALTIKAFMPLYLYWLIFYFFLCPVLPVWLRSIINITASSCQLRNLGSVVSLQCLLFMNWWNNRTCSDLAQSAASFGCPLWFDIANNWLHKTNYLISVINSWDDSVYVNSIIIFLV